MNTVKKFAAVKGSGIFSLDEFCMLTGVEARNARRMLARRELIVKLEAGHYLLKPLRPAPARKGWYDWNFDEQKQRAILEQCRIWTYKKDIGVGLGDTALSRYLRAMCLTGNLEKRRNGLLLQYRAKSFNPLPSYKQAMKKKKKEKEGQSHAKS